MREKSILRLRSLLLPRLLLLLLPDLVVDTVSVSQRLCSSNELIPRPLTPRPMAACDACSVYRSPEIDASRRPSCPPCRWFREVRVTRCVKSQRKEDTMHVRLEDLA